MDNYKYKLIFDDYVNIDSVTTVLKLINNITGSGYTWRVGILTGVQGSLTSTLEYTVYPQPATDAINIKFPESSLLLTGTVEIYTSEGILTSKVPISTGETATQIDIKNLSSGVYYLKINNTVKPFVVVK